MTKDRDAALTYGPRSGALASRGFTGSMLVYAEPLRERRLMSQKHALRTEVDL